MTRLLFLLALLFASGAATAQETTLALRLDGSEMKDGAISAAGLARGLHVVATGADAEPQDIILFSALVVEGEVVARGRTEFVAMPVEGDGVRRGVTLRDSRLEADRRYAEQRAETPMRAEFLMPSMAEESVPGGDTFFPGDLFLPGDQLLPGDQFSPEAEAPVAFPGDLFVGGRVEVEDRRGAQDRDLVRAAERAHPEAFRNGEAMLVFFAAPARGSSVSDIAILRKRPGR